MRVRQDKHGRKGNIRMACFTTEDVSEEELKYFLEEYWKISIIKTRRNRFLVRNEALVCYRTAGEANTALADINMY